MEKKVICKFENNNYVFDVYSSQDLDQLKDYLVQVLFFVKSKNFINKLPPRIKILTGSIPFGNSGDKHFDYLSFIQEIEKEKYILVDNRLKKDEFISEILFQLVSQMFPENSEKEKYELSAKIIWALIQNYKEFETKKHLFENKNISSNFLSLVDLEKTLKHLMFMKNYGKKQINIEQIKSFPKVVLASILISIGLTPLILKTFITGAVISSNSSSSILNVLTLVSFFLGISLFLISGKKQISKFKILGIYDYPSKS
jgi:hypothetical protein